MKLKPADRESGGNLHVLRLADRDRDLNGWTRVSKVVWPTVQNIPDDLLLKRANDDGTGSVKVTDAGKVIIKYC